MPPEVLCVAVLHALLEEPAGQGIERCAVVPLRQRMAQAEEVRVIDPLFRRSKPCLPAEGLDLSYHVVVREAVAPDEDLSDNADERLSLARPGQGLEIPPGGLERLIHASVPAPEGLDDVVQVKAV